MNTQSLSLNAKRPLKFSIGPIFLLLYAVIAAIITLFVTLVGGVQTLTTYILTSISLAAILSKILSLLCTFISLASLLCLAVLAILLLCKRSGASLCIVGAAQWLLLLGSILPTFLVVLFAFIAEIFSGNFSQLYYRLSALQQFSAYTTSFAKLFAFLFFLLLIVSFVTKKGPAKLWFGAMCLSLLLMPVAYCCNTIIGTTISFSLNYVGPSSLCYDN